MANASSISPSLPKGIRGDWRSLSMVSIGRRVPKKRNFRHGLPMWLWVLARHVIFAYIFCGEMRECGNGKYMNKAMVMPLR